MTDKTGILAQFAAAIPTPVYYLVGGAVGAVLGFLGWVYKTMMKKQDDEIKRVETQVKEKINADTSRIERQLHARMDRELGQVNSKLDQISSQLIVIASNTSRRMDDMPPEASGNRRSSGAGSTGSDEGEDDDQRD